MLNYKHSHLITMNGSLRTTISSFMKFRMLAYYEKYNFAYCFVVVWKFDSHGKVRPQAESVKE